MTIEQPLTMDDLPARLQQYRNAGFFEPGWDVEDYMRFACENYGWENFPIWGIKGSKKSNRLMWYLYSVYQDWDLVHKYMVMQPLELTRLLKDKGRIPMIGWDDIAAWFDSQLYFENRTLYTKVKRCWTLMRTKLNVFACTLPRKDELARFILNDITGELFCSPKLFYTYDRWTWEKNLKDPTRVRKVPVAICRNKPFNMLDVPTSEFKIYWKRRMGLADIAANELVAVLEEAFDDTPENLEMTDLNTRIQKISAQITASRTPESRHKRVKELKELMLSHSDLLNA